MEDIEYFVPEFEYHEKDLVWYLYVLLFAFFFIFVAYLTKNPTFVVVIMLGGTLLLLKSNTKPQLVPFAIHDKGIYFKNKFWDYKDIKDYSLHEDGAENYFVFTPIGSLQSAIRVPVKDPETIRLKLNNLCSQVEYEESLIDILIRSIGL